MQNYSDRFKILNWNSFDVTCKNKGAIFTHCIIFTGPLSYSSRRNCFKFPNLNIVEIRVISKIGCKNERIERVGGNVFFLNIGYCVCHKVHMGSRWSVPFGH